MFIFLPLECVIPLSSCFYVIDENSGPDLIALIKLVTSSSI